MGSRRIEKREGGKGEKRIEMGTMEWLYTVSWCSTLYFCSLFLLPVLELIP